MGAQILIRCYYIYVNVETICSILFSTTFSNRLFFVPFTVAHVPFRKK